MSTRYAVSKTRRKRKAAVVGVKLHSGLGLDINCRVHNITRAVSSNLTSEKVRYISASVALSRQGDVPLKWTSSIHPTKVE